MALDGQASGDFTESSSALRVLYRGVDNSIGVLTNDAFTQSNPAIVATNVSTQLTQFGLDLKRGVLSGTVCFARPDAGSNFVGGPVLSATVGEREHIRALGVFMNDALGQAFENLPGQASGKGPYVSSQGSYGNQLFETDVLVEVATNAALAAGTDLVYTVGQELVASRNGLLMPRTQVVGGVLVDISDGTLPGSAVFAETVAIPAESNSLEGANSAKVTTVALLKMPNDAVMDELVYDQRI